MRVRLQANKTSCSRFLLFVGFRWQADSFNS